MRVDLQPAYVLHSRPYRDTSLILEAMTPEHGRISLVARGARRQRRGGSQGAMLQPFVPLLLSFSGRSEMKNLVASEIVGPAPVMRGQRLFSAMYVNELLVRLLHRHDPQPAMFAAYANTLEALASDAPLDCVLRKFELSLLDDLGYALALGIDGHSGQPVRARARYLYLDEHGLVEEPAAPPGHPPAGDRRRSFPGAHLLAMEQGRFDGEVRDTAKQLLRQALTTVLGPEPLRSRELFRTVRDRTVRDRTVRDRTVRDRTVREPAPIASSTVPVGSTLTGPTPAKSR